MVPTSSPMSSMSRVPRTSIAWRAVAFERFGAVHVLCNNAGVVKRARSWALTLDDWRWVLGVDLWSVVHAVRAFVPRMLERRASPATS